MEHLAPEQRVEVEHASCEGEPNGRVAAAIDHVRGKIDRKGLVSDDQAVWWQLDQGVTHLQTLELHRFRRGEPDRIKAGLRR